MNELEALRAKVDALNAELQAGRAWTTAKVQEAARQGEMEQARRNQTQLDALRADLVELVTALDALWKCGVAGTIGADLFDQVTTLLAKHTATTARTSTTHALASL